MRLTVEDYGVDLTSRFVEYHRENGGISRYQKFDHFLRNMADSYTDAEYQRLLSKFSSVVRSKLLAVDLTAGAVEFIRRKHSESILYIVSGGDQSELREVFTKRGLSHYFQKILGSPTDKSDHCNRIRNNLGADSRALFIGDSRLDHQAAQNCDFDFIFLSGYTDMDDWRDYCAANRLNHYTDLTTLHKSNTI
jgi:phosphoglycolate phosphatase-like HAD superfamily hydrolase